MIHGSVILIRRRQSRRRLARMLVAWKSVGPGLQDCM